MKWNFVDADESAVVGRYHVGRLTGKLLAASNLDEEQIQELLYPDLTLTTSRADCVVRCAQRILLAKERREKVFIGGDYDADGICSTAIMKKTLDLLGIENGYYVPDRFKEGYGLSSNTVRMAAQKGYTLIVTVDNGVKAHEALLAAKDLGIEVIVTDHHRIEEEIECDLVVHPDYMEHEYQFLSGAGVALQISRTLVGEQDDLTVYAAAAAVGDVMPLWRETRRIVQVGMNLLKRGIPRQFSILLPPQAVIDENTFSFNIVPKLNSVARMNDISNVNTVVRYLLTTDESAMIRYAQQLNHVNETRKQLSETETRRAMELCTDDGMLVLYDETFHEGICGLIAGRIASQYQRPVLVMAKNGDTIKGSGRSVPGFDLFSFLSPFEEKTAFGGHEQAVGLSVKEQDFPAFREHVRTAFEESGYTYTEPEKTAVRIRTADLSLDELMDLDRLSPYPKEMVEPNFVLENCNAGISRQTAKMTKYTIPGERYDIDAVLYGSRNVKPCVKADTMIGRVGINRFRGNVTIQMILEDLY